MLLNAVVILLVSALLLRLWQKYTLKKYKLQEINMPIMPFIGHLWLGIGGPDVATENILKGLCVCNEQGGVAALWVGYHFIVAITDPTDAEFILKNHIHKGGIYKYGKPFLGNGSLISSVRQWRRRRQVCAPLFSPKNLSMFVDIFARQSQTMTKLLREAERKSPTELWLYFMKYAFDAVCISTLGINIDAQNNPDHPFPKAFTKCLDLLTDRVVSSPMHLIDTIYKRSSAYRSLLENSKICYDFVGKIVNEAEKRHLTAPDVMQHQIPALTELLAQNKDVKLSTEDQCEEVLVFAMAGMDTSAIGMSFTLHMLARHQDVQEKVYRELMQVFTDSNQPVTDTDLPKLEYLECVIKETLRLYPPVTVIGRTPITDVILPSGRLIPKKTFIIIGIYGIHHNKKYWGPDADQFRPERFLEPFKHPKQFIPFSDGPRNCIGYKYAIMSMKTALANLLRQYRVSLPKSSAGSNGNFTAKAKSDPYQIKLTLNVLLKDRENVRLCLESRQ